MIKRVLYNERLEQIGNTPIYAGKPVYSDGNIAYGWMYSPQIKTPCRANLPGFWVNETSGDKYRLLGTNLSLRPWRGYSGIGGKWCFPWVATDMGIIQNKEQHYTYEGTVVAMAPDGRLATLFEVNRSLFFRQYASDGTYTDTPLPASDVGVFHYMYRDHWSNNGGQVNEFPRLLQLATVDGCYITLHDGTVVHIGGTETAYPDEWPLSDTVTLRLSDMALIVDGETYDNDPLGLLQAEIVYPGGVHACRVLEKDFVISQDTGIIWTPERSAVFNGLIDCFNLVWTNAGW